MASVIKKGSVAQASKKREIIYITNNAAKRILFLLLGKKKYIGIRIKVLNNKGCYGKQYHVEYIENQDKFDEVVLREYENSVVKVFIDPKTVFSILGTTIDYVEEKFKSGFIFNNPKENGRCGCGKSFH